MLDDGKQNDGDDDGKNDGLCFCSTATGQARGPVGTPICLGNLTAPVLAHSEHAFRFARKTNTSGSFTSSTLDST